MILGQISISAGKKKSLESALNNKGLSRLATASLGSLKIERINSRI
jgi:hypothetical protein